MPNYFRNVSSVDLYTYFGAVDGLIKKHKGEVVLIDEDECGYYTLEYTTDTEESAKHHYDVLWKIVEDQCDTPFEFETKPNFVKRTLEWTRIKNVSGSSGFAAKMCTAWESDDE
jgi:hypothetical protein